MRKIVLLLILGVCGLVSAQQRPTFHRCNWCGVNAFCYMNTECRCPAAMTGNPYFLCYLPHLVDVCQVCDDPVITTQNSEDVTVSYFNSTFLVDQVERRSAAILCRVRVFESRERVRGKSVPRCIRVRLDFKRLNGVPVCSFEYKIFATSDENGNIEWRIETGQASPGGDDVVIQRNPWTTLNNINRRTQNIRHCGCLVRFTVTRGNILYVRNSCCRNVLGIRPFVRRIEWLKSGMFITFPRRNPANLPPGPLPSNLPLCLRSGFSLDSIAERLNLASRRHAMSFLALTNLPDEVSDESPARTAMRDALLRCSSSELKNLFDNTFFMVNSAPFIREISGDTEGFEDMMEMVRQSAEWFCEGDVSSCRSILETIDSNARSLVNEPMRFPMLAAFVANNCTA